MSETSHSAAWPQLSKADASLAIIWSLKASELIKEKVFVYLSGFLSVIIVTMTVFLSLLEALSNSWGRQKEMKRKSVFCFPKQLFIWIFLHYSYHLLWLCLPNLGGIFPYPLRMEQSDLLPSVITYTHYLLLSLF